MWIDEKPQNMFALSIPILNTAPKACIAKLNKVHFIIK
jgi:hypothetical protein